MAIINLTYNGYNNDSVNYISFTDLPNIVTLEDLDDSGAQKATYVFEISALTLANQDDGRFTIELFGESISSVKSYANAVNKNFWISSSSNNSTAASIAKALRNCQSLVANYLIENYQNHIRLTARDYFETDIQSNYFVYDNSENPLSQSTLLNAFKIANYSDGQDPSVLTNARVSLDIYSGETEEYVTTLEKVCPSKKVSFNISPILTSLVDYGMTVKYQYRVSYVTDSGTYNEPYNPDDYTNYVVVGGDIWEDKIVKDASLPMIAAPLQRGNSWAELYNHTLLYVYDPVINLSIFRGSETGGTRTIDYLDSAFNTITSYTDTWTSQYNNSLLLDIDVPVVFDSTTLEAFNKAFYIDITILGVKIRYSVIKPLKASEGSTKLYWRNRYGGVSFFEFTGKKTTTSNIDSQLTYKKNIYDYYDNLNYSDEEKIYGKDVERSVTVKSHLIEQDAKYLFQDLEKSKLAWTFVNGIKYDIIIDSVAFDEIDNNNNLFEATVKYNFGVKF